MATYKGWTIYSVPSAPAPRDIKPRFTPDVAVSVSPFNGAQQTQDWGGRHMSFTVSLPPMNSTNGLAWVNALLALVGPLGVFQFPSGWASFTGWTLPYTASGYWRLTPGQPTDWSVSEANIYGLSFQIEEAL